MATENAEDGNGSGGKSGGKVGGGSGDSDEHGAYQPHLPKKGFSSLTEFYCQFQIQQMHNNKTLGFCFDLCKFRRALTSGADIP